MFFPQISTASIYKNFTNSLIQNFKEIGPCNESITISSRSVDRHCAHAIMCTEECSVIGPFYSVISQVLSYVVLVPVEEGEGIECYMA